MSDSRKILLYSVLAGAGTWLIDALATWIFFDSGRSLPDLLFFNVPEHDIYMRLYVFLIILLFGVISASMLRKSRRAEAELKKKENLLSNIIDQSPFSTWIANAHGTNIRQNRAYRELMGIEDDSQTVGKYNLLEDNLFQEHGYLEKLEKVFLQGLPATFIADYDLGLVEHVEVPKGRRKLLKTTIFPIKDEEGRVINAVVQHEDITEKKKVEDAIRESEERFRTIFDISRDLLAIIDESGRVQWANLAWCDTFGYKPDSPVDWFDKLHPEHLDRFVDYWETMLVGAAEITNQEFRYHTKSGKYIYLETTVRRIEIGQWVLLYFDGHDVTARKRVEKKLAEEKERLAITLRSIGDGVIATNESGEVILINRAAERLTGWSQEEAVGRPLPELFKIFEEASGAPLEYTADWLMNRNPENETFRDIILQARSGEERLVVPGAAPINDRNGRVIGLVLVFSDVTEKRRAEKELQRADKLESLGSLAGGIAHDFNNVLTAILGNIELAGIYATGHENVVESLERAKEASLTAKELTGRLLTFSKGGAPLKRKMAVSGLIRQAVSLALSGSNVKSELELDNDLWPVEVDSDQLTQALNNIIINSVQAMPEGGEIRLRAENLPELEVSSDQQSRGSAIRITLSDNGPGIPRAHLPKIFDPFFTTKERGSGLGLAVVYSVVRRHGGRISVSSEVGKGTSFEIALPAFPEEKRESGSFHSAAQPLQGLRILLMDDEMIVRNIAVRMLEYLGHEVVTAEDGTEAIEKYKRETSGGRPYDLAILDLTVPGGMGGRETIKELKQFDPAVKAIVTSGYSGDPVLSDYRKFGFSGSLVKPYIMEEVREVLNSVFSARERTG
ncbi:MAG: hypothetical protein A3F83_12835 [Candidatus Glassbacteria bacterium RIFCSPLOWO2_12_FULL_58_11]|uniref:histidine kinase n=1 Tax=Candidatus Glassbacteria bacterium RIFCSPLOWO2_12_FULL_58_11 TaxID=1817867 RepID=A0A1F5YLG1_9BACT|nr:MAG: hypothetical protein A3F83_12835 [Candidatus Glassbacteria bacterium RIFCSPLOWO2_12_FULL_58_11]